ncbi:MAG: HEPN domain-containing protein [Candidatus Kerfeldbacteria bacterium]|nr:HEPN domain-containing protein [Candidatus Kerfeldbacteria bacterium]
MNVTALMHYCQVQSAKKWNTATALLRSKRYADCLFFCHLTLEFALKEKVVKVTQKPFPMTHDLSDLAIKAHLMLTTEQKEQLAIINTFNIAGRYDDYKLSFYKKAKSVFTKKYFDITNHFLVWLKKI